MAISIGLQMVLPFPFGLGAALALFIALPLLLRRRYMSNIRGGGTGSMGGGFFGLKQEPIVKYACLVCNNRFKGSECPRCGSKSKRADF